MKLWNSEDDSEVRGFIAVFLKGKIWALCSDSTTTISRIYREGKNFSQGFLSGAIFALDKKILKPFWQKSKTIDKK